MLRRLPPVLALLALPCAPALAQTTTTIGLPGTGSTGQIDQYTDAGTPFAVLESGATYTFQFSGTGVDMTTMDDGQNHRVASVTIDGTSYGNVTEPGTSGTITHPVTQITRGLSNTTHNLTISWASGVNFLVAGLTAYTAATTTTTSGGSGTSYTVSGAGTAAANGPYSSAGADGNGNTYYKTNNGCFIYWSPNAGQWYIGSSLPSGGNPPSVPPLYSSAGGSLAAGPTGSSWAVFYGSSPAPMVSTTPSGSTGGGSGSSSNNNLSATLSPTAITLGQSTTLTWTTYNTGAGSSVLISGQGVPNNSYPASGSLTVTPNSAGSVPYTVTNNANGTSVTVTVQVSGPPAATITATASPATITLGQSTTISWSTVNATGCTSAGTTFPANGSTVLTPTSTGQQFFPLQAVGPGGNASIVVTFTVNPASGGTTSSGSSSGAGSSSGGGSSSSSSNPLGCLGSSTGCGAGLSQFIPGLNIPVPTIPNISLPGDVSIGIPGIGSFTLPSGWWSQVITFAATAALQATNLTGSFLVNGMTTSANAINAQAAAVGNTLHADNVNLDNDLNTQFGFLITDTVDVNNSIIALPPLVGTQVHNVEQQSVTDYNNMGNGLLTGLLQPSPTSLANLQNEQAKFLNWGPYSFIISAEQAFNAPASDGTLGSGAGNAAGVPRTPLSIPNFNVNTDLHYGQIIPGSGGVVTSGSGSNQTTIVAPGTWYVGAGSPIPLDFKNVTNTPGWVTVRDIMGGAIWCGFIGVIMSMLMPKQTV